MMFIINYVLALNDKGDHLLCLVGGGRDGGFIEVVNI
jgi:hypothetical protein